MKYLKSFKLFEKNNKLYESNRDNDLLQTVDEDKLTEFYKEKYPVSNDLDDLLEYASASWIWSNCIDDDKFVENFIEEEIDHYQQDWEYNFDSEYEKEEYLIPFIENRINDEVEEKIRNKYIEQESIDEDETERLEEIKNMDYSDILQELDNDYLKELVDNIWDNYDFIKEYLEKIYEGQDAQDILKEFGYEVDDIEFFQKNTFNIQSYIDKDTLREGIEEDEYTYDNILDRLSSDLDDNVELQTLIYEALPKANSKILVEEIGVLAELAEQLRFQESYCEEIIEKEIDTNDEDWNYQLFLKLEEYFIDNGVNIDEEIIEKYNLEQYTNMDQFGMFNK